MLDTCRGRRRSAESPVNYPPPIHTVEHDTDGAPIGMWVISPPASRIRHCL
jgi:hypothetical protein